jgi:hypothetical protein
MVPKLLTRSGDLHHVILVPAVVPDHSHGTYPILVGLTGLAGEQQPPDAIFVRPQPEFSEWGYTRTVNETDRAPARRPGGASGT